MPGGFSFDENEYDEQVEQTVASLEASPEPAQQEEDEFELTDVDTRLETADYYRAILSHQFFDVKSPAAKVVDREIRAFIKERLEVLLGIRAPRAADVAQFTEEEANALRNLADPEVNTALTAVARKVLGKSGSTLVQDQPAPKVKKMPTPPAKAAPKAFVKEKPKARTIPAPPQKARVEQPLRKTEPAPAKAPVKKKAQEGDTQTYVNHEGQEVTLVEGEVIVEEGRRYVVARNASGTLYRKDVTGQVTQENVYRAPPMSPQQMEMASRMAAEQQLQMLNDTIGMAIVGSLSK